MNQFSHRFRILKISGTSSNDVDKHYYWNIFQNQTLSHFLLCLFVCFSKEILLCCFFLFIKHRSSSRIEFTCTHTYTYIRNSDSPDILDEQCLLKIEEIDGSGTLVSEVVHWKFVSWRCLFSPWRIVDDCGGAFALGAIGGTLFHSIKGFRHAPSVRIFFEFVLWMIDSFS